MIDFDHENEKHWQAPDYETKYCDKTILSNGLCISSSVYESSIRRRSSYTIKSFLHLCFMNETNTKLRCYQRQRISSC